MAATRALPIPSALRVPFNAPSRAPQEAPETGLDVAGREEPMGALSTSAVLPRELQGLAA